ncbi:uncharacterized protein LOC120115050 [Hibiscus syriacus]|uniref:uncharacterized protein LOC120115050 n=1 Tax=Hibiscus syriacus TaxID=106335 RepID=UPI0019207FFB|nr:uncharacterized protein LOC120115050 [Hibiscus syriacus]
MDFVFAPAEGASGGLVSLWDRKLLEVSCSLIQRRFIAIKGKLVSANKEIGVINVYGPNSQGERREFFETLKSIISSWCIPVIVGGDFNSVRWQSERIGAHDYASASRIFEEFIFACDLVEVPNIGSSFTWFRGGGNAIASRLDRFLISTEIYNMLPQLVQFSLPRGLSYHKPIVLKEKRSNKVSRPFKWFNSWAYDSILVKRINDLCVVNKGIGINNLLLLAKNLTKDRELEFRELNPESAEELGKRIEALEDSWLSDPCNPHFQLELSTLKARLWAVAGIKHAFVNYFSAGYNLVNTIPLKKFDVPLKRLTAVTRRFIECPFSEDEVWHAIKSSDDTRAPGPDGFSLDFFKKFWQYIKGEVMKFMEDFYWGKVEDLSFNKSFIALIPKKAEAISPDDFRPISLVGSLYKIISRVLARRLGSCIIDVIEENQFAFIRGKLIADYSLIANEVIDGLLKSEALSGLIKKASDLGLCCGVEVGVGGFILSHIQFADDLLIFSAPNPLSILNFKRVLKIFEVAAGLKLNMGETKIFGFNVEESRVRIWVDSILCGLAELPSTYLGLPRGHKKNSLSLWNPILDKVTSQLQSWKGKLFSFGGRLTLIQSVLVNLPVYYMSIFSLLKSIADKINRCIANFVWNGKSDRCIHWIKWEYLCRPKSGIFDVKTRNRSLFNKWIWRFSMEEDSLWRKIVVAKYNYDQEDSS